MYKVIYKNQCIVNPYKEVIAYSAVDLLTETSAALLIQDSTFHGNSSVVLFENDVHIQLNDININNLKIDDQQIDDSKWLENANYFFKQCPLPDSNLLSFLFMDVFANSKKHFVKKQIILISSAIVLLSVTLLVVAVIVFNIIKKPSNNRRKKSSSSSSSSSLNNEQQLIEQTNNVQIKSNIDNNRDQQEKILLQTSC